MQLSAAYLEQLAAELANQDWLYRLASKFAESKTATFTGLIIKKQGVTRGRGAARKVYGDDQVHVSVVTGFKYENLVAKSLAILPTIEASAIAAKVKDNLAFVGMDEKSMAGIIESARAELKSSFEESLAGTNESTTDHVYEPLELEGETVRSCRVYRCVKDKARTCHCRDCTGDDRAPKDGTIYLQGLQINSTVLTPAPNGPAPAPASSPLTVAKDAIRSFLPVSRYVSYRLEKGGDWVLKVGGKAALDAQPLNLSKDEVMKRLAAAV